MTRLLGLVMALTLAILAAVSPQSVAAKVPVDPETLIPVPPMATCWEAGQHIICETGFVIDLQNEPLFDLPSPCGLIYETVDDVRRGIRWYDADTRTLVKRLVFQDVEGYWTLSPTGDGPRVALTAHSSWSNTVFPDLLDESTWPTAFHGNFLTLRAPGYGVIAHISGREDPDGDFHGRFLPFEDWAVMERLCDALTAA